jgi:hypothetical protein
VSETDALGVSQLLKTKGAGDKITFEAFCDKLNVESNIATIRTDSRTSNAYLQQNSKMKSSNGVVREHEEAPGGIFARSVHRGTHGWGRKGFNNTQTTAEDLFHGRMFENRREEDAHHRLSAGNRKKRVEGAHTDHETYAAPSEGFYPRSLSRP